jgi:predicted RNA-binding Zn-ribbon protein involved in translation (DUF1610 family)
MPFWNRKKKREMTIKLCPTCKKPTLKRTVRTSGWMSPESYICEECGYSGAFYIEVDLEESGDNFVDMEKLKKIFPDDVDPETDIDLHEEIKKNRDELEKIEENGENEKEK